MGRKFSKLLVLVLIILILPIVAGQSFKPAIISEPVYTQNEDTIIRLPCTIDGRYCSTATTCFTTIIDPNGEIIHNNASMIKDNAVYEINVTADDHNVTGEYEFNVACSDDANNSVSRFLIYHVTPNGEIPSTAQGFIYISLLAILVLLMVLALVFGFRVENFPLKVGMWLSAYMMLVGVSFIAWNLSLDFLSSSPFLISFFRIVFIFFTIGFFPLLLVMSFYTVYMMIQINTIQKLIDTGVPSDEAYERTVKKGLNWRKF